MHGMRLLLFVLFTVPIAAPARLDTVPDEISRLDECIQLRFLDAKAFGMRRILPMQYHGLRSFVPENATERAVVDQLQQKNYEVAFYLVGRNALDAQSPFTTLLPRRSVAQGPAFITPVQERELPQPEILLEEGRRALISFQTGQGYDIRKAGWTVAMRPLRASSEKCVQCHAADGVKMGDPLGAALYVYRREVR